MGEPGRAAFYSDRACSPRQTLDRLRPHFASLGITRLARQTGLDTVGIPCFSAIRPNAKTLAVSQGKGLDDDAAMVSAAMEAAELAIAEREIPVAWIGSATELDAMDAAWFDPTRLLPFADEFDRDRRIGWVVGKQLFSHRPVLVPRDAVRLDGTNRDLPGISQNTNGLASGNSRTEAEFHALCELVERDATTNWWLLPADKQDARAFPSASLDNAAVTDLEARIERAGLKLVLFDLTTDTGTPTVLALVGPAHGGRYFDIAAGFGTHPIAARAAVKAITEAAQSRVTAIAGSRDDIAVGEYDEAPDEAVARLFAAPVVAAPPRGLPDDSAVADGLSFMSDGLVAARVAQPVSVPLGGDTYGISVVRLLSQDLEDRDANTNWRPGPRAISILLGAA